MEATQVRRHLAEKRLEFGIIYIQLITNATAMHRSTHFMTKDKWQKLAGVFALAFLLFNFPIINLFSGKGWIFSLPILYVYIFGVWLLIILLTFRINRNQKRKDKKSKPKNKDQGV